MDDGWVWGRGGGREEKPGGVRLMHVNTTYSDMLLADCLTMLTFRFFPDTSRASRQP